jgi:hypothetical protein
MARLCFTAGSSSAEKVILKYRKIHHVPSKQDEPPRYLGAYVKKYGEDSLSMVDTPSAGSAV